MKVWLATAAVLLLAGAAVTVLLVDPHVWRSDAHRPAPPTVRVVQRDPAQGGHSRRDGDASPFALKPAARNSPVNVRFSPANEPRAGILFDVHTGRVLWEHDPGRRLPIA